MPPPQKKNEFSLEIACCCEYSKRYLWGTICTSVAHSPSSGNSSPCPLRDLRHFVDRLPKCKKSEGGREFLTTLQKNRLTKPENFYFLSKTVGEKITEILTILCRKDVRSRLCFKGFMFTPVSRCSNKRLCSSSKSLVSQTYFLKAKFHYAS